MLGVKNIDVCYGDVQILWDISLQINEGEIVTVIGPNGAGKSTLLKTIMGLLHPKKRSDALSHILYKGSDIKELSPEEIVRKGIGIVPEGSRVFPELSVIDNLRMGSYIKRARVKRDETLSYVFALFPLLKERMYQSSKTLSGGERQMLAIGRALMSCPELLLLDEPSLGLEPRLVQNTFENISRICKQGMTVLLVEQNVHLSLSITDRAYVLENGRIALEGKGSDLESNEHIKKAYLSM